MAYDANDTLLHSYVAKTMYILKDINVNFQR